MMACNIADGDQIVDLLLSKEADVNAKSKYNSFPRSAKSGRLFIHV